MQAPMSGVQRYVQEITAHLPAPVLEVAPAAPLRGLRGHAWEQCILPTRLHGALLWSPSNTGPLATRHQVLTLHDALPFDHPEWLAPAFRSWYRWLIPRLARRVERVITISGFSRDRLIARLGIRGQKIAVIPHGVAPRFFPRAESEVAAAGAALRLPSRSYLLSVCSLDPRKNLQRLLAAWEAVGPAAPPDLWLVLAGQLSLRGITPRLNLRLPPRTLLAGHVADEDLPALLSGALAFVYPSLYEG
ncbi:MAG: glycosyltransferase family 4 protein, partial [Terriglobales bacterium]